MTDRAREKWRPSLGLVIFAVLASVAALPLVGLFFFRLYDNQLIHQTQAELIAQSRVLAAVYAREVEARLNDGIVLGAEIPPEARPDREDEMTPIRPALDLAARGDLLRRRPDALPASAPGVAGLCRDRQADDADHSGYAEGHAGGIPDPRSSRRRDRRARRSRPIARPYRGGGHRLAGTISRRIADSRARQDPASDLLDQPRRRRSRLFGDACHRQQPRCRGRLHVPDAEQYFRSSLSGARQVHPGGPRRYIGHHHHRPGLLPDHHPADARTGRSRRAHQPRRSRRIPAARPLRHPRVCPALAQLSRHGAAIVAAIGLYRNLLVAPHP